MEMDREKRYKKGRTASLAGLFGNVFLAIIKVIIGFLAGSTVMIADGVHSFSDVLSTLVVMVSLKISSIPADASHPYGHGKAESIAGKLVALMLMGAGLILGWEGIKQVLFDQPPAPGISALWAAVFSILTKELLYQYTIRVGKKISSPAVISDAHHHRSDAFSSWAALIGIAGARLGWHLMDPLAAIIVAIFIIRVGWKLIWRAIDELMDAVPDETLQKRLEEKALSHEEVQGVDNLRVRSNGPYYLVDLELIVSSGLSALEAHEVGAKVKELLLEENSRIQDVLIHVDPEEVRQS